MSDLAALGYEVDTSGLKDGERALDRFTGANKKAAGGLTQVDKKSVAASKSIKVMAKAAAGMVAALGAAFASGAIIRGIAEFDSSMSSVAAVTRATTTDLQAMRDMAKDLGSTTEFSAAQAADGFKFLGMAGFNAKESIAALPAVLDLATASGMGLGQAADTASNIMSGFAIAAGDAARVSDVLAAASTRSNTTVNQLGAAMSTAAPIANALGISLEDTAAAIGVMSDAGIQGERAGTALRSVMASLSGPTSQAQEALAKYGLTAADVNPETHELAEIMKTLGERGLSTADAMTIFGREAASGALVLVDGARRVREFGDELRDTDGAAKDMAATMRDNLGGDIKGLQSAVSGLILAMGEAGLTAALRATVQGLTVVIRGLTSLTNGMVSLANVIGRPVRELLGLGKSSRDTSKAINETVIAISRELIALDNLSPSLIDGTVLSQDAAQSKLQEAKAIYEKIEAARSEALQAAMLSEAYKSTQREIDSVISQAEDMRAEFERAGGPFAPNAAREGLEKSRLLLQQLFDIQRGILKDAAPLSDEYNDAKNAIEVLERAIENSAGGMVTLSDGTDKSKKLAEELARAAGTISFDDAIEGAGRLGDGLYRALDATRVLLSEMSTASGRDGAMARARLGTVGDPVERAGAEAAVDFRYGLSDGGYGLISGGAAQALAEYERIAVSAAEATAQLEQEARAADQAFLALSSSIGGGGGGGEPGEGGLISMVDQLLGQFRETDPYQEVYDWYNQITTALSDAQLLERGMIEEHNAYKIEIEKAYQQQIAAIRAQEQEQQLQGLGQFFGAMAVLFQQGGERMQKIAVVFSAAEALINSWVAFTQALRDPTVPFWGKIAAGVTVLAAGLKAVRAIRSVGSGGSGTASTPSASTPSASTPTASTPTAYTPTAYTPTSGAASSASSSTVSQQAPQRTVRVKFDGPAWVQGMVEPLMSEIYDQTGDGTKVIFAR